jgi:ferritin-like protein
MSERSDRYTQTALTLSAVPARATRKTDGVDAAGLPELPPKPEELSWRDYLILLLHIAAEIEHGLMVQYLYAAYSLGGPGAARHPDRVREWHDVILTVAREEMGHLITVQNVLLLIGGPVSFNRDDFPWSSPFYPFEFALEPFSLRSLACYVYAEMPKQLTRPVDIEVRREVLTLVNPDAPTVGEIYDRIIRLVGDPHVIPDSTFDPDSSRYQATWDEWGRGYRPGTHQPYAKDTATPPPYERKTRVIVTQMATRTEALAGLRDIAGQGEAEDVRPGDKMEDSHFDRFARIFRSYQKILKDDPDWSPSRLVPRNPYAGVTAHAPKKTTAITAQASLAWASLLNIRYRMLLSLLTYTYRIPHDVPDSAPLRRAPMLGRIFGEMYNLKAIAGILVRLPLGDPAEPARAGPPFQVPYSLTPPLPEANFWRMQLDLLSAASELVATLLDPAGPSRADAPADGARYLQALREADRDSRTWIEKVLAGLDSSRRARA